MVLLDGIKRAEVEDRATSQLTSRPARINRAAFCLTFFRLYINARVDREAISEFLASNA